MEFTYENGKLNGIEVISNKIIKKLEDTIDNRTDESLEDAVSKALSNFKIDDYIKGKSPQWANEGFTINMGDSSVKLDSDGIADLLINKFKLADHIRANLIELYKLNIENINDSSEKAPPTGLNIRNKELRDQVTEKDFKRKGTHVEYVPPSNFKGYVDCDVHCPGGFTGGVTINNNFNPEYFCKKKPGSDD